MWSLNYFIAYGIFFSIASVIAYDVYAFLAMKKTITDTIMHSWMSVPFAVMVGIVVGFIIVVHFTEFTGRR